MSSMRALLLLLLALPAAAQQPDLGPGKKVKGGLVHEVALRGAPNPAAVWIYLPDVPGAAKLPCVLIAPAGTPCIHGIGLAEGDRPEHLPWLAAGFIVVAYTLDGQPPKDPTDAQLAAAMRQYFQAEGGLRNARAALDYAVAKVPRLDPTRVLAAGHSSAATVALHLAANEPRIKACVAFAPEVDIPADLAEHAEGMEQVYPGFGAAAARISPHREAEKITCPLFLFAAEDDTTVSVPAMKELAAKVKVRNKRVEVALVPRGGHYDSMLDPGLPRAIAWVHALWPAR
jgi:dipeptidyl aminopeptidase/acylaminoacyl peptidase